MGEFVVLRLSDDDLANTSFYLSWQRNDEWRNIFAECHFEAQQKLITHALGEIGRIFDP